MTPIQYLYSLELHGIKLGLDNILRLLRASGEPQLRYPTVHVAGTNGKGSVVAMLDAMLRAAGYRTARFTSPHLISIRERFLVGSEMIAEENLERHIELFRAVADDAGITPTFFELCTAIAFQEFAEKEVDVALIEVGMGGRFDSTNVLRPEVSVITNIALEHTKYLGDTLELIAFEKAGILKERTALVTGETQPGPREVILDRARELGAPVALLGRDFEFGLTGAPLSSLFSYRGDDIRLDKVPLGLPGPYQGANAAVAVATAQRLRARFPRIDATAIRSGLVGASWPCRLERVLDEPEVIIDVAHNAAGAKALTEALPGPCVMVVAVAADKDASRMLSLLSEKAQMLILSQFEGPRALPVDDLAAVAPDRPHDRMPMLADAIALGLREALNTGLPLVITGSLFTAGQARRLLIDEYHAEPLRF